MKFDPEMTLRRLLETEPAKLDAVPDGPGIYALYDHEGLARYIGIAATCLRNRIFNRHVTGDENSHKFSSIYNAGRMFHSDKHPSTCPKDGKISKKLRSLFVRENCRAVAMPMPDMPKSDLRALESAVIALAPTGATSWNNRRWLDAHEPTEALNNVLEKLSWTQKNLDAIERQAQRWENFVASPQIR
ncbi:hypothetical protein [Parvibaculum sp.]|uniref:hypothetical protein n=1 Tax=Parvibaculum sp. TaxID=2024848 RepID=UPI00329A3708